MHQNRGYKSMVSLKPLKGRKCPSKSIESQSSFCNACKVVKSGKCTLFNRNLKGFLQVRFGVFGPYFEVPRLGHYKSTFLFWRSKIGVQKQGVKSVKWWFLYLNLHKATLKGLGIGFGPFSRHFNQNSTNSKSAILLGPFRGGSSRFSLPETPKQGFEEGGRHGYYL